MRLIYKTANTASTLILGVLAVLSISFVAAICLGYRPVVVQSGSMTPVMPKGSLAFDSVVSSSTVRVGQIISFDDPAKPGHLISHRIYRILHKNHITGYMTKGDANAVHDPWIIKLPAKVGRVRFHLPYAGYLVFYATSLKIKIIGIAFLCVLMLIQLLGKIWELDKPKQPQLQES